MKNGGSVHSYVNIYQSVPHFQTLNAAVSPWSTMVNDGQRGLSVTVAVSAPQGFPAMARDEAPLTSHWINA